MGWEYKASEKGKETARIDDVDLYNLTAIRKMGKRARERNRVCGGPWDESVECRRKEKVNILGWSKVTV